MRSKTKEIENEITIAQLKIYLREHNEGMVPGLGKIKPVQISPGYYWTLWQRKCRFIPSTTSSGKASPEARLRHAHHACGHWNPKAIRMNLLAMVMAATKVPENLTLEQRLMIVVCPDSHQAVGPSPTKTFGHDIANNCGINNIREMVRIWYDQHASIAFREMAYPFDLPI